MPRRSDTNQPEIVEALRDVGGLVLDLHEVGADCPDVLVLFREVLTLLEIKSPGGKLTPGQQVFHDLWRVAARGRVYIVRSVEDAYRAVGVEVT